MPRIKISFPMALFASSFAMCLLVAFFFMDRGDHDIDDGSTLRAPGTEAHNPKPEIAASLAHETLDGGTSQTALAPELVARPVGSLPATPTAGMQDNRNSSEADADPSLRSAEQPAESQPRAATNSPPEGDAVAKALTIFESRTGTPAQPAELPVSGPESNADAQSPGLGSGRVVPRSSAGGFSSAPALSSGQTPVFVEPRFTPVAPPPAPSGEVAPPALAPMGSRLVAPLKSETPADQSKGMLIGREGPMTQTDAKSPQVTTNGAVPPPIALPEGVSLPQGSPTPSVLRRLHNVPTNLIQTPYPTLYDLATETSSGEGGRFDSELRTDAAAPPPVDYSTFHGPGIRRSAQIRNGGGANSMIPTPIPERLPMDASPAGSVRSAQGAQASMGVMTNAGAEPSPTPMGGGGKWNLPPAPTLPPKLIAKATPNRTDSLPPPADLRDSAIVKPEPGIATTQTPPGPQSQRIASALPDSVTDKLPPVPSSKMPSDSESGIRARLNNLPAADIPKTFNSFDAQPVASVGNKTLLGREALRRADAMLALRQTKANEDDRRILARTLGEEWAEVTAIASEAQRQGVSVSDEDVRAYIEKQKARTGRNVEEALSKAGFSGNEILEQMRDPALCEKLLDTIYQKQFDENKLRAVYDASPDNFRPARRLHVMEIFKARSSDGAQPSREMEILQRKAAKGDFSEIASQSSESPSRAKGGDLGWLDDKSYITPETAEALLKLSPGQVSGVIESPDGYRILKLVEIQEPKPGFEAARDRVVKAVREYLRRGAYETAKLHMTVKIGTRILPSALAGKVGAMGVPISSSNEPARSGTPISPDQFGGLANDDFGKPISADTQRPVTAPRAR